MTRLHVLREGQGPTLLLLHGIGSSATAWSKQMERLGGDFTCLAPDLPGYGESPDATRSGLDGIVGGGGRCLGRAARPCARRVIRRPDSACIGPQPTGSGDDARPRGRHARQGLHCPQKSVNAGCATGRTWRTIWRRAASNAPARLRAAAPPRLSSRRSPSTCGGRALPATWPSRGPSPKPTRDRGWAASASRRSSYVEKTIT